MTVIEENRELLKKLGFIEGTLNITTPIWDYLDGNGKIVVSIEEDFRFSPSTLIWHIYKQSYEKGADSVRSPIRNALGV